MSVIEAKNYYDAGVYSQEKVAIFEKEWLFVCMRTDIPKTRDWVTVNLFGKSIVIYNTGKDIKAFLNVCPHRFNRIFPEECGNSPIVCKYHNWGFNEEGQLLGKKDVFPEPVHQICLKSYRIDAVGDFIFLHLSENPDRGLAEQLGPEICDLLNEMSSRLGAKVVDEDIKHTCNWKFIIENVIENNHCLAVHKNTLVKIGYCKTQPTEYNKFGNNSNFIIPPHDVTILKKREMVAKYFFEKKYIDNLYKQTFIYPNLLISNTEGANYNINTVIPLNENECVLNFRLYHVVTKDVNPEAYDDYKKLCAEFALSIFMEDKAHLDTLQSGVTQIGHSGFQYVSEKRVEWFISSYKNSIENGVF